VSGPVALHGGGEFQPGDEPFLEALLTLAAERSGRADPALRVAIVPTAAARGQYGLAAAHGVTAFERVGRASRLVVDAAAVPVVDTASAADGSLAAILAAADIIHFPGGDPDLLPVILRASPAWDAIRRAWGDGAVLAGASAGAMALAAWTWTPSGGMAGLGVAPGLVVVPHADAATWTTAFERFGAWAPVELGVVGLAERTGAIAADVTASPVTWRVVGPGEVRWMAIRGGPTVIARAGETLQTLLAPSA
jgi:cyanophycinase-like exopeptidase